MSTNNLNLKIISCTYSDEDNQSVKFILQDLSDEDPLFDGEEFPYGYFINSKDISPVSQWLNDNWDAAVNTPSTFSGVTKLQDLTQQVVTERNFRLSDTDYLMQPDYPITDECREAFKVYRQQLRDITKQDGFPENIVFPEIPEVVRI